MLIQQQAQVGHHILDLFALIELAATDDLVGNIRAQELFFDGA